MTKSILAEIADLGNLHEVWREFYKHHRKSLPGLDGIRPSDFAKAEQTNLLKLRAQLRDGYAFSPLAARAFRKPNGKYRIICIPTVSDRIVQKAVIRFLIDENHDRLGLKNGVSFAFLKGEGGVRRALEIAKRHRNKRPWAYKADITAFFDRIQRKTLLQKVSKKLKARSLLPLIEQMICCEAEASDPVTRKRMEDAAITKGIGLRQGMPISPLLANLQLDEFDAAFKAAGLCLVRYADDFIVLADNQAECLKAHDLARTLLSKIGHHIHDLGTDKTTIASPDKPIEFLGMLLGQHAAGTYELFIDDLTQQDIFDRLGKLTDLNHLRAHRLDLSNLMKLVRDMQLGFLNAYADAEPVHLQAFRDKLEAKVRALPETILKKIFPASAFHSLSPDARAFLCLT